MTISKIKIYIAILATIFCTNISRAFTIPDVHCPDDTIRARQIMDSIATLPENRGLRIAAAAKGLQGIQHGTPAYNTGKGTLTLSLHRLDPISFINNSIALGNASATQRRWFDYSFALENISRRKGIDNGFASVLIYGADWIVDNVYRGNIKELTDRYSGGNIYKTKSLDYITHHKDQFPALADSATYESVRMNEMGYRTHRIPHLKKEQIRNSDIRKELQNGDIIMLLSKEPDYDIYDMGIVCIEPDGPHLIHIDRQTGVVREDPYDINRTFKNESQYFYGWRWLRAE